MFVSLRNAVFSLCMQTKAVLAQRVLESLGALQPCAAPVAIIAATLDARRAPLDDVVDDVADDVAGDVASDVAPASEASDDYNDYEGDADEDEYE